MTHHLGPLIRQRPDGRAKVPFMVIRSLDVQRAFSEIERRALIWTFSVAHRYVLNMHL